MPRIAALVAGLVLAVAMPSHAGEPAAPAAPAAPPAHDAELARKVGADARGMRRYVVVVLRTGPKRMPDGDARKAMFAGHMANIGRLSAAGKLVLAGPFAQDPAGWRGLFVFAVDSIEEARRLTETDPVIVEGEMVAEYHPWYGSAGVMLIPEIHAKLAPSG